MEIKVWKNWYTVSELNNLVEQIQKKANHKLKGVLLWNFVKTNLLGPKLFSTLKCYLNTPGFVYWRHLRNCVLQNASFW